MYAYRKHKRDKNEILQEKKTKRENLDHLQLPL